MDILAKLDLCRTHKSLYDESDIGLDKSSPYSLVQGCTPE